MHEPRAHSNSAARLLTFLSLALSLLCCSDAALAIGTSAVSSSSIYHPLPIPHREPDQISIHR